MRNVEPDKDYTWRRYVIMNKRLHNKTWKKQIYIKSTRTKVRTNEVINAETEPTRLEIFWLNTNKDKEKKGDEMEKKNSTLMGTAGFHDIKQPVQSDST